MTGRSRNNRRILKVCEGLNYVFKGLVSNCCHCSYLKLAGLMYLTQARESRDLNWENASIRFS